MVRLSWSSHRDGLWGGQTPITAADDGLSPVEPLPRRKDEASDSGTLRRGRSLSKVDALAEGIPSLLYSAKLAACSGTSSNGSKTWTPAA